MAKTMEEAYKQLKHTFFSKNADLLSQESIQFYKYCKKNNLEPKIDEFKRYEQLMEMYFKALKK